MATELVLSQLGAPAASAAGKVVAKAPAEYMPLGLVYFTEPYSEHAAEIVKMLKARTGVLDWVGCSATALVANQAEYLDEPALAVMLAHFPQGSVRPFSGLQRPPAREEKNAQGHVLAHSALAHVEPATHDIPELLMDLGHKLQSGLVIGGIASGREHTVQVANAIFSGGISGLVFADSVRMITRVSQGCQALTPVRQVSAAEGHFLLELDQQPALEQLLADLGGSGGNLINDKYLSRLSQGLFIAQVDASTTGNGRGDYLVRNVVGIDPERRSLAVGLQLEEGDRVFFCSRDAEIARADLVRACTEIRDEMESVHALTGAKIKGALFISCVGRGANLFGEVGEEVRLIQQQLGNVPLIGFYASGEVARSRLYTHSAVLTVFF
jgi:small ligand-binding sensory domain FIST